MYSVTRSDVLDIAPELASVDPARFDRIISVVTPRVSDSAFGLDAKLAASLLIAHTLTMLGRQGNGPVTSERVGDMSRSYAAPVNEVGDSTMYETSYGRQYMEMVRSNVVGIGVW